MHIPVTTIALALARAMLSGSPTAEALAARVRRCLDIESAWCTGLADRAAVYLAAQATPPLERTLAAWIDQDEGFAATWEGPERFDVRGYFLTEATWQGPLPLNLERCFVPYWPHAGALAEWLGIPAPGLWRLTRSASWQRHASLGDQHYRYELLAKRTGGWRLLEVPHPYLKALQRRVLDDLLDRIPPHDAACAYMRERSVVDHAKAHVGQAVLLKFDLQDFFATVRASRVHATFAALGYPRGVARELMALCTTATPEPVLERLRLEGGLTWLQCQRLRDAHLPQGAPTSAALANLCAFGLDLRIDALARELGARYTRYADDIVLSGGAHLRTAATRLEARIGSIALDEGFALNHRKTRCLAGARRQQVCNIVVNTKTNLPRAEFDRLKAILHGCVVNGPASQNREGVSNWREHLRGRVAWAAQLNADKAQRLQRLAARIDWNR